MRIVNDNELNERKSDIREPKFKVFAMFEGNKTEVLYFSALFRKERFSNIEYLYFKKEDNEVGWSNPRKLVDYICNLLNNSKNEVLGIELLNFDDGLSFRFSTYDCNIDKIALIVDRDEGSFTENQYDYVIVECEKHNIDFVVTNPCFEFYLLLHLSNCKELALDNLDNETVMKYLVQKDKNYKKERYNVEKYVSLYETAVKNAKYYKTDIDSIKNNIGTNIGEWINKILELAKNE